MSSGQELSQNGRSSVRIRDEVEDLSGVLAQENAGNRYGVERVLVPGLNLHLVQILDGTTVNAAILELSAQPGVLYAASCIEGTRRLSGSARTPWM